ncbi:MAG: TIM barrel protein [Thaumarchaeota archaeon]|nr:TIM barrel protein [Nitrososphaerota archaeon]
MKVGLSTWSLLKLELIRSIGLACESGLQCIELWGEPPHAYPGRTNVAAVRDALSQYDVEVSVHGPFHDLNPGSVYRPLSESVSRTLKEFVRFAEKIDATTITFHSGHAFTEELVDESIRGAVHVLRGLVKEAGGSVRINVENEILNDSGFAFYLGSKSRWLDLILSRVPGTEDGLVMSTSTTTMVGQMSTMSWVTEPSM